MQGYIKENEDWNIMLQFENKTGKVVVDANGYLEAYEIDGFVLNRLSMLMPEATQINGDLYNFYEKIKIPVDDNVGTFLLGTLVRIHKDYQCVLILLSRGLQSQAKASVI